jgi:hypothetical protein
MNIVSTIVPIFIVIFLGLVAKQRGFFTPDFLGPANRLVYYFAIPAMIFNSISKATLRTQFNLSMIMISFFSLLLITIVAWKLSRVLKLVNPPRGPLFSLPSMVICDISAWQWLPYPSAPYSPV